VARAIVSEGSEYTAPARTARTPSQRRHIAIGSAIVSSVLTIASGSAAITASSFAALWA